MKKRALYSIMVLALVLGLALSVVTPVMAQATNSLVMVLLVSPSTTTSTGTLHYTVILINLNIPGANNVTVDVNFYPPGATGAAGAYGTPVQLDNDKRINVGESVTYNWDGAGGALARPALAVDLGAIPLNPGVTVVYAASEFDGLYIHVPQYVAYDMRNVPAQVTYPDTEVTITSSQTTVVSGGSVTLTVTEHNSGDDPLTNPYVEVRQNGVLIATLDETTPAWSSDLNGDAVLDADETWSWTISSGAITATTTFEALGFGTDSLGHEVSYATGYLGERDDVIVNTHSVGWETYPINKLRVLLPWVALLAAVTVGAGLLVLRRRRS